MSNIKPFLEQGTFIPPSSIPPSAVQSDIIFINRKSPRLNNASIRFVVVDTVEKFKADYWDRVVCVFTTGQAWQFKDYKWSSPRELFMRVKGFTVQYEGEPVGVAGREWNVEVLKVGRNKRYTDRQISEQVWERLEQWMDKRGMLESAQRR
jgi:parafibromin